MILDNTTLDIIHKDLTDRVPLWSSVKTESYVYLTDMNKLYYTTTYRKKDTDYMFNFKDRTYTLIMQ